MKHQFWLGWTRMIGVLLISVAWAVPGMQAQAEDQAVKAPAATGPSAYWWFRGSLEVGGRFFLNDPRRDGSNYLGQESLAKYYEYSDISPGAFGNLWLAGGTKDGLYQIDFGGKNIGYNDQEYYLDSSKAGEHYLSLGWDQTPHLYSTSAQTFFRGVGTPDLRLPSGFARSNGAGIPASINPFLYKTDIGIRRDTASGQYRWTPTEGWDIKADYSHMHRDGTQVDGVVGFGPSFPYGPTQVPRPVDDTTQNYGLNGEYAGTSPWGKPFNLKLAYKGSTYSDSFTGYTIADPINNGVAQPIARLSTWPSNKANTFSGTLGADLPLKSRYAGTLGYTAMRQDDSFIPMSANASFLLPQSSLGGAINTLLSNNIITTQIRPDLTSKLSYRYYDFKNDTPEILFRNWIHLDETKPGTDTVSSLSMAYTKQNAGAELNWRPLGQWNLGAAYGFERYDWTRADVGATNENSGKVHADWKPTDWFSVRSSAAYATRRFDNYDYFKFVANTQFAGDPAVGYSTAYRQLLIDNRNRLIAKVAVDVVVIPGLTVTPTFKYQDDYYGLDPNTEQGLTDSRSWNAGVDLTYIFNPDLSVMVGYLRESYDQFLYGTSCSADSFGIGTPCVTGRGTPVVTFGVQTNDRTTVDTFTAAARYSAIRNKLDLSLRYTLSHGTDRQQLVLGNGADPTGGQFPDVTNWFHRFDAVAAYKFDKALIARLGWKGDVRAKLHYAWEYNSMTNWQNDTVAVYNAAFANGANAIFMAFDNPNYNVHMVMLSLEFKW
jgi:MtrB/PioB family decaheme-associated outer membrane protein